MNTQESQCALINPKDSLSDRKNVLYPSVASDCQFNHQTTMCLKHAQVTADQSTSVASLPCLKRSDSFLIALSTSALVQKPTSAENGAFYNEAAAGNPAYDGGNFTSESFQSSKGDNRKQMQQGALLTQRKVQEECSISSSSDEQLCRICHDGEDEEELVSPCYCTGSVGLLHLSCLERWLGTSQTTRCELCKYEFTLKRLPRPLIEFIHDPPTPRHRRNLVCDLGCFVILTPITIASAYLCSNGALQYSRMEWASTLQVQGLTALTICLLVVYLTWLAVGFYHHFVILKKWRAENQLVKITYTSPVKGKRTLRSSSVASSRFEAMSSPLSTRSGSIAARGSASEGAGQQRPSLISAPALRPILKYSTQYRAASWHSDLNDFGHQALNSIASIANGASSPTRLLRFPKIRQETYV